MNDNKESSYEKLWTIARRYLRLKTEDLKLTLAERITILISTITVVAVITLLGGFVLLMLTFAAAHWLGDMLGLPWAFLILAGIYTVLILLLVVLRKQIIINPVTKFVTRLILK